MTDVSTVTKILLELNVSLNKHFAFKRSSYFPVYYMIFQFFENLCFFIKRWNYNDDLFIVQIIFLSLKRDNCDVYNCKNQC